MLSGLVVFSDVPNVLSIVETLLILPSGVASVSLDRRHSLPQVQPAA